MRLTIFRKLFISLLLISTIMMIGMAFLINNSFQTGLQTYLNDSEREKMAILSQQVSQYYTSENGWLAFTEQPGLWSKILRQSGENPRPEKKNHRNQQRRNGKMFISMSSRLNLLDLQGNSILGKPLAPKINSDLQPSFKIPLISDQQTVGWLTIIQRDRIRGPLADAFFEQQLKNFYLIAALAALFSFVIAALLVKHFLKPLKRLQLSAKALINGDFQYQVAVTGNDELAELSQAFNRLTDTLKSQKQFREQWLADISHELRTPIAILQGEIEALEDGLRQPEPKYLRSLHEQVVNLGRLVNDLYLLSVSDADVLIDTSETINLTQLVENSASQNEVRLSEKNIQLTRLYDTNKPVLLNADLKSMTQLISNIFENSYRYTDPDGKIVLSLLQMQDEVLLIFEDSSPDVPDEALGKLFDRLYRVDKSRSRASGGSGLGLSICQNIVDAHGGQIKAEHSNIGGVKITISLPIKEVLK
jgi:two-component system sensor histidine kinase BaeS